MRDCPPLIATNENNKHHTKQKGNDSKETYGASVPEDKLPLGCLSCCGMFK